MNVHLIFQSNSLAKYLVGVATISSQQAQNQSSSSPQQTIVTNVPLLVSILQAIQMARQYFIEKIICSVLKAQISNKVATQTTATATGVSNDISTLMTGIIQSPTHSLQNQAGTFHSKNKKD